MPRFLLRTLSALTLVVGLLTPASMAVADDTTDSLVSPQAVSQCPTASICVWDSTAYTGSFASTTSYSTTTSTLPGGVAHSIKNSSTQAAYLFSGALGSGTRTCLNPGASVANTSVGAVSFRLTVFTSC